MHLRSNERGQSVTVFFAVVVMALLLVCGVYVFCGGDELEAPSVAVAAAKAARSSSRSAKS